jgi:hypothetical protein
MRTDKIIKGVVTVAVIGAALFGLNKWATRDRSEAHKLMRELAAADPEGLKEFQEGWNQGMAAASATAAPAVSPLESWIAERAKGYLLTTVDRVRINPDASTAAEDDRVVLVDLTYEAALGKERLKSLLTEYADDLAAGMAAEFPKVTQIAVFWSVPKLGDYSAKNSYTCRDGLAYFDDVVY